MWELIVASLSRGGAEASVSPVCPREREGCQTQAPPNKVPTHSLAHAVSLFFERCKCSAAAEQFFFSADAATRMQGLLRARPRHAEDQSASDRGETAPPSAPARARSVNTYARPSSHGNIRASRAHSLTCSADRMLAPWAADDPVGRAARPPHTIRQARDHPQRAAARRAALPAKPAPPSCTNRAHNRVQHTAHTGGARAAHADARATATRTRTQHARVARQRSATHRAHLPSAAAGLPQCTQCAHSHNARARTPPYRRTHWASP